MIISVSLLFWYEESFVVNNYCMDMTLKGLVERNEWMRSRSAIIVANTDDDEFEKMRYIANCDNICFITISVWREFRRQRLLYEDFERFGWKK